MQAVSGIGLRQSDGASLAVALAVVVASFAPLWGLLLWVVRAPSPPWRWWERGEWLKCIAWLAGSLVSIALAFIGWIWVYNDVVGPGRRAEQQVVFGTAVALGVLWILGLARVQARDRRARTSKPPQVGSQRWKS
jgi:hypothetical protein